jgi:hypothetical protein
MAKKKQADDGIRRPKVEVLPKESAERRTARPEPEPDRPPTGVEFEISLAPLLARVKQKRLPKGKSKPPAKR